MTDKDEIADLLGRIGQLLELKGENPFKTRAYAAAARAIENFPGRLEDAAKAGELDRIPGVGKAIAAKIAELISTSRLVYYDELVAEFPAGVFQMLDLPGLGPKKLKVIMDELGVVGLPDLYAAATDGRIAELQGFGEKSAEKIATSIDRLSTYAGSFLHYSVAGEVQYVLDKLKNHPSVSLAEVAGSFRRGREIVHDIDFLAASKAPADVLDAFSKLDPVEEILAKGATKCSVRMQSGVQADLRVVSAAQYPFALAYFTGNKEHNVKLRGLARDRGWTLNEYGLAVDSSVAQERKQGGSPPENIVDEAGVHAAFGLDYIPPELREDIGEIEAARSGTFPRLVELENLRGVFHVHTTASDGRGTLSEMVDAARDLGLDYLGIADHSKSSFQANGLDAERLAEQMNDIARLNEELGKSFHVFTGTECDILKSGALDFPDEILSRLDYVVASVHASFTMGEAEMTKRVICAISNPNVTMLGHITGRLLLTREPYKIDVPAIIDAAADTGTIIELNCSPQRVELDWRWWPLAKEKGVLCAINPDAHRIDAYGYLRHGVSIARKGWLTRDEVINTLPFPEVKKALGRKRARR